MNFPNFNPDTVALTILIVGFIVLLLKWHHDSTHPLDVRDALINADGKFSLSKLGQLVAMVTSTWIMIFQTRAGTLTEAFLTAYLITWAGANALSKYTASKQTDKP
jgi:hypothetical protein